MRTLLLVCAILVVGCADMKLNFKNRVACTVDGKQGYLVSMYINEGLATTIEPSDSAIICKSVAASSPP